MPRSAKIKKDKILSEVFKRKSKATLARDLKISRPAVGQWNRVPDWCVRKVSEMTGISLKRLRPDLYDPSFRAG